jgi:hypothetical protein
LEVILAVAGRFDRAPVGDPLLTADDRQLPQGVARE